MAAQLSFDQFNSTTKNVRPNQRKKVSTFSHIASWILVPYSAIMDEARHRDYLVQ